MIKNLFWNSNQRRLRALWRQLIQLLLALSILIPLGVSLLNLLALSLLHQRLTFSFTANSTYLVSFPLTEAIEALAVLLSVWLMARFINRERFRSFGFQFNKDWWLDCGFGLLLGLFLNALVFLVELSAGWLTIQGSFFRGTPDFPFALIILIPFALFVCAAFYEETLFRGYPLRNLAQGSHNRWVLVVLWLLAALPFGLSHAGNPHAVPLGIVNIGLSSLLFGLSYILTGNLGLSIGLHIAWDFCQGSVFGLPVAGVTPSLAASVLTVRQSGPVLLTGGAFGPDGGLLVTAAFLLGMLIVLCYLRLRYGKLALSPSVLHFQARKDGAKDGVLAS